MNAAVDYLRQRLAHFAAKPPEELEAIYQRQVVPLVNLRTSQAADLLRRVARAEKRQRLKLHEDALAITAVFEGAGRIFDTHAQNTRDLYAKLRGDLADTRLEHERQDKDARCPRGDAHGDAARGRQGGAGAKQAEAMELLHSIQIATATSHRVQGDHRLHEGNVAAELSGLPSASRVPPGGHARASGARRRRRRAGRGEGGGEAEGGEAAAARGRRRSRPPRPPPPPPRRARRSPTAARRRRRGAVGAADPLGITKALAEEEDLWATFGLTYDDRMAAQIALDDELAGLEAARRVEPPPDPRLRVGGRRGLPDAHAARGAEEDARRAAEAEAVAGGGGGGGGRGRGGRAARTGRPRRGRGGAAAAAPPPPPPASRRRRRGRCCRRRTATWRACARW